MIIGFLGFDATKMALFALFFSLLNNGISAYKSLRQASEKPRHKVEKVIGIKRKPPPSDLTIHVEDIVAIIVKRPVQ